MSLFKELGVGVMQAVVVQGVDEGLQHMLLAHHFAEYSGAPFARQNLVRHILASVRSKE